MFKTRRWGLDAALRTLGAAGGAMLTRGGARMAAVRPALPASGNCAVSWRPERGHSSPYLNTQQAAHFLGIGWRKLMRLRVDGAGPMHRRHGRLILYHVGDLERWSQSQGSDARGYRTRARLKMAPGKRRGWAALGLALGSAFLAGLGALQQARPDPLFLVNRSLSAPRGLYALDGGEPLLEGQMVAANIPSDLRLLAARRKYVPGNVPLIKRIAAVPGDRVCAFGDSVSINGVKVARRHAQDGAGRWMPWWSGCASLGRGEYFLLMEHPSSFDGRYFGLTARSDIRGKARLLWPG